MPHAPHSPDGAGANLCSLCVTLFNNLVNPISRRLANASRVCGCFHLEQEMMNVQPHMQTNIDAVLSQLPNALVRALQEGWQIAPVSAHSKFASLTRSCLASPSNAPAQIADLAVAFPESNWCVLTGRASGLMIVEVNHENGQDGLCELCNDEWETWTDTLKFSDDSATFFLFRHSGQRLRFLSSEFEGIKVHTGNLVLLPPSWFVVGPPLDYSNLNAPVLDCPEFLLAACKSSRTPAAVIPFSSNSVL